jgi:hypothetical protein
MDMGWEFELNFNVSVRKKKFTQIHFLSSHTYNNGTEQDLRKEGKIRGGKRIHICCHNGDGRWGPQNKKQNPTPSYFMGPTCH